MKKILFLLFVIVASVTGKGQITTAIVKANFGVEADLTCNFYNNAPQPAVDDWFGNGLAGTGQGVIDTTGAAGIVAGYTSDPASRMNAFSRLMRYPGYTIVNNRLLLDAIFHRDYHGTDSTVFAAGSNKNGMSPFSWTTPVAQGIPDKNDILDAMTHVRRAGPNATDSLWMFSAISIENITGSRYFDFELYQTDIAYNRTTRTFVNYGPDMGHTSWKFDAGGNIITPGDIIFTAEFSTASITLVEARIWVHQSALSLTPQSFSWGGAFDGAYAGAPYGYARIVPKTAGAFYTGIQSTAASTWAGPFALVREDNSVVTSYVARQFMEFSVNLTKLGIEPANFGNSACGTPFRRVLIKTRSSTSFTAELKDFVAPFRMFDYPAVEAGAFLTYFCDSMPVTPIRVTNPNGTSVYTWSTTNGNIVGSNVGTQIFVNAPGTYTVTQQLHFQCPQVASDSVTIIFDTVCSVLNVDIRRFNAFKQAGNADLRWEVDNNQLVSKYDVEYSLDGRNFYPVGSIPADERTGTAEYSMNYSALQNAPTTFFRLRLVGRNGVIKYSQISTLKMNTTQPNNALIFPNPVNNVAWLSMEMQEKSEATILIMDSYGKLINKTTKQFRKGSNMLNFEQITKLPAGIYLVKIRSGNQENTQKVVVL